MQSTKHIQSLESPDEKGARGKAAMSPKTGPTLRVRNPGNRFLAFARDFKASSPMVKVQVIRKGVNSSLLIEACAYFGNKQSEIGMLLGMSPSTTERRVKAGGKLTQMESERLARLAMMESEASEVFGNEEKAKRWLTSDHKKLGAVPLSLLDTEVGANEVRKVLMAIAHGLPA